MAETQNKSYFMNNSLRLKVVFRKKEDIMKKSLVSIVVFMMLLSSVAFGADFRKANWGMSKEEVKQSEGLALLLQEFNAIQYLGEMLGYEVLITYLFEDGQLKNDKFTRGAYGLTQKEVANYNTAFKKFKKVLTKKYGKPSENSSSLKWKAKHLTNFMTKYCYWDLPDKTIELHNFLEGSTPRMYLLYSTKKYGVTRRWYDEKEIKKDEDDL
jgi:hypothetical protein